MKKAFLCAVVFLLVLSLALPALAGTCYVKTPNGKTVNLRSPDDNTVLAQIPYGTKLSYDDDKSTELAAYVTYKGLKGYVRWVYLSDTKPAAYAKSSSSTTSSSTKTTAAPSAHGSGLLTIKASGAYIQYPNKKGKGAGDRYSSVFFDDSADVVITASIPRGKKLIGWKINGIYMTFYSTVKTFRLPEVTESMTIEAVFK